MMILDTSVWIEYFKANEPYFQKVQRLIENRSIYTIEPIFGELLQGALSAREKNIILTFWSHISKLEIPELFIKAGELSHKEKLVSKGIKLIDASIIYATLTYDLQLWTLDKKILNYMDKKHLYIPD